METPVIFETHAHYDDEAFAQDRENLLALMQEHGIGYIVNACASIESLKDTEELMEQYPFVYGAFGIHPDDAEKMTEETLEEIRQLSRLPKAVAIGEIGLDYYWHKEEREHEIQKKMFRAQMEIAREEKMPFMIHSRDAARDTLELVKECMKEGMHGGIIHCFSYGKEIRTYDMKQSLNAIHKDLVHSIQKYVKNIFGLQLKGNIIYQITYTGLNAIIYLFLGYKIIVKKLISIGDFSLYLNAITTFNSSVQAMIAAYIDISNNGQYIKDYFDFIELSGRADSNGIKLEEKDYLDAEIVFENVSFIYPNQEKKSLSNINLTIKKGERISIVGENGAGKTTFIKLLDVSIN